MAPTLFAEEVYANLEPLTGNEAASGNPLRALVRAIGSMFAQPEEAVRALGDGKDAWERVWNPDLAPTWLLPFVGQGVGVKVDTSATRAEQVAQIKAEGAWHRGTVAAIVKAVQATLFSPFNLVPNPSFEVGTAKWNAGTGWLTAGATLTRVTTQHEQGVAALQVVTTAVASEGVGAELPGTFRKGVAYTASIYLKGNAGGEKISVGLGTSADHTLGAEVTLTTSWQRVEVTWTPSADRTGVLLVADHVAASIVTFFVDAAQVEVGKVASAYFDGSSPGFVWEGTPNESTSRSTSTAGSKSVRVVERNSTAWTILLITRPGETPNPAATKTAAQLAKPGGMLLTLEESDLPLIDEGTREIDLATTGTIDTDTLAEVT